MNYFKEICFCFLSALFSFQTIQTSQRIHSPFLANPIHCKVQQCHGYPDYPSWHISCGMNRNLTAQTLPCYN